MSVSNASSNPSRAQNSWQRPPGGKFEGGIWHCACDPAPHAAFLQVKKEGNNKGRWFYTCQKPREEQCGFFMWENVAKAREQRARNEASVFNRPLPAQQHGAGIANGASSSGKNNPRNNGGNEQHARRAETPHREVDGETALSAATNPAESSQWDAASTMTGGGPLYSPASSIFFTPAPRQRIFRGIPRAGATSWSSDDDSDGSSAEHTRYPCGMTTPTPKRKRSAPDDAVAQDSRYTAAAPAATTDLSDIDADMADELVKLTDQTERLHHSPQSPRSHFSDPHTTPGGGRPGFGHGGLPTPESGRSFAGAGASGNPAGKRLKTAHGMPMTPTPARTRNALAGGGAATVQHQELSFTISTSPLPSSNTDNKENSNGDAEITTMVLSLLPPENEGRPVSAAVRERLRETLNTHARRARGVERARDTLRQALRARDEAVAALQARVAVLENERRMRREVLRSDLLALSQEEESGPQDGGGSDARDDGNGAVAGAGVKVVGEIRAA
ncbi:hypothetical protein C7999DRAFT_28288 [Corynascus novoguineensis]|uniref:GRF-type domain-containing protein n=1 Tax=Corynascus novoguineensis TaxID=1126955 RepID=A0AAN7D029_9PEZI|nr:hypothetical protein C7999DRAFT_28288 [Corynascus novoguineensis]